MSNNHTKGIAVTIIAIVACVAVAFLYTEKQPTQEDIDKYQVYINPFAYQLGAVSWDNPSRIEPDALFGYYLYLELIGESSTPKDNPVDEQYGNPLMLEETVETAVQKHLDVSAEQMRRSQYYNAELGAYWTGGTGSTVEITLVNAKQKQDKLLLIFTAKIDGGGYEASWNGKIDMQIMPDGAYKYLSFTKENFKEKYT